MIIINHLLFSKAKEVLKILGEYDSYIVGGYPRDKYLGIKSNDIDICTNATSEFIENSFKKYIKNNFGGYLIYYKGCSFELTRFRKDIYENNRYPKIEYVNTLKEDLYRRDFIINTLCIDKNGEYVDLLCAKDKIDNRLLDTIIDSNISFKQDPLRIIRAIRFKVDLDFIYSKKLLSSIIFNKSLVSTISKKRLIKEIKKVKNKKKFNQELAMLDLQKELK